MTHSHTLLLALAALASGCASYEISDLDKPSRDTGYYAGDDSDWGDTAEYPDTDIPPEAENDFLALKPSQTDVYVFVANPSRGTITRVNVFTKDVRTTAVGNDPSVVLTSADYTTAAVFNRGDDSVSIVDAKTLDTMTVGVRDNFNNMVMSPHGDWVALWHDVNAEEEGGDPNDGLQSFNEASFVDLTTGEHHPMVVGPNPREIQFTPDGTLALVVSDEYLALVDLTAERLYPELIQVAEDLIDAPRAEEVVVEPSGSWAFVRQFGAEDLLVVDLLSHGLTRVPVGSNPTDLDLSPDGAEAVVVARGSKELYVFDSAEPLDPPKVLDLPETENLGSVLYDPTGYQAVLYTTASLTDHYASWDVATDEIQLRSLVKPVRGMAITPTGETLMAFHTEEDAPDADPSSPFYGEWALTLIDLRDYRSNPLLLPAEPTGYANSTSGDHGYFIMEGERYLVDLEYDTLLYDEVSLKSDPVYVGVFPDLDLGDADEPPAWVSQEHDLGRITFYDPDAHDGAGSVETITGFELNSQIED